MESLDKDQIVAFVLPPRTHDKQFHWHTYYRQFVKQPDGTYFSSGAAYDLTYTFEQCVSYGLWPQTEILPYPYFKEK